ncbi:hypothetical protein K1F50_20690 [Muricauda oceani]|uniref:hypothetical protein n=1 Tax=Flagellimonas oceani TaxID=2698672 RepID=UPI001C66B2B4|nr:hypothetical protein [Allomuricauda oceani]MBW8245232.1 hypothetical protein [Allomuricauda oceani]
MKGSTLVGLFFWVDIGGRTKDERRRTKDEGRWTMDDGRRMKEQRFKNQDFRFGIMSLRLRSAAELLTSQIFIQSS